MKIGDRVVIINSPYYNVKNGSIATIKLIIKDHFGEGQDLYILKGVSYHLFREHEIKLEDKNK
jgi:hypothetical protein